MMFKEDEASHSGCSDCPVEDCSAGHGVASGAVPFSGSRFVWICMGFFLAPVILAAACAVWFRENAVFQLVGALVGLGTGMAVAVMAARWFSQKEKQAA